MPPVRAARRGKSARACAGRVGRWQRVDHQYSRNVRGEYLTERLRSRLAQSSRPGGRRQVRATGTRVKCAHHPLPFEITLRHNLRHKYNIS